MDQYGRSVHFAVASCTDQQKVIECLQSRLLAIKIPSLEAKSLEKIALRVINGEGLNVESDALNHIISVSRVSKKCHQLSRESRADRGIVTPEIAESLCTDISWKEFELYVTLVEEGSLRWVRLSYYTKSRQGL